MYKTVHKEDWDFYLCNVDDYIASIFLDLGLKKVAPISELPNIFWLSITMNNPREDGLSSSEEFDFLSVVEDIVTFEIEKLEKTIYVGRLTTNGKRDFYFYTNETEKLEQTFKSLENQISNYKYETGFKENKDWSNYINFLYPSPLEHQKMFNRRVIDQLEENGDNLTKEREVNHWLFFKNYEDLQAFIKRIENNNFNIVYQDAVIDPKTNQYQLQISRVDKVDYDSINDYVIYLWEIANELNADYDGWETSIEKE